MNTVYNSPPNWPAPPAGWTPPPGWAPDPSWPEPPPDWQFQIPAPNPPARRKRRLWLVVGLPITLVVLLIAGGITTVALNVVNTTRPVKAAATSYLQAIKDQRYEAAFAMRCSADLGNHDAFMQGYRDQRTMGRGFTGFKVVGVNVETTNGRSVGQVTVKLRRLDGSESTQRLHLTKTGSTWNPCP
jgi:hypothetical protein